MIKLKVTLPKPVEELSREEKIELIVNAVCEMRKGKASLFLAVVERWSRMHRRLRPMNPAVSRGSEENFREVAP